jgi:hypothetical protein
MGGHTDSAHENWGVDSDRPHGGEIKDARDIRDNSSNKNGNKISNNTRKGKPIPESDDKARWTHLDHSDYTDTHENTPYDVHSDTGHNDHTNTGHDTHTDIG